MKQLLKNRNFLLLIFGRNTSVFGDVLLTTALALYVLLLTESPKMFGTILATAYIPRLILSTFAGMIVDRLPKKILLICLDLFRGCLLIALVITGDITLTKVYIIILTFAAVDTFFVPASIAIIPKIIRKQDMANANSIDETLTNLVTVLSPIIASLLYVSGGITIVFIIDGITFIISGLSELFLVFDDSVNKVSKSIKRNILGGILIVKENVRLTSLVINGALTHLFLFPFIEVGITTLLLITFKAPEVHYGIIKGVMSGSAILAGIAALIVKNKSVSLNINRGIIGMIFAVSFFLLMISSSFTTFLNSAPLLPLIYLSFCSFMIILAFGFYAVFFRTFYQSEVPPSHLGRFTSVFMIFVSLSRIIGMYAYGILFERFHIIWPLLFLATGMILKLFVHIPFLKADKKRGGQLLKA